MNGEMMNKGAIVGALTAISTLVYILGGKSGNILDVVIGLAVSCCAVVAVGALAAAFGHTIYIKNYNNPTAQKIFLALYAAALALVMLLISGKII